MRRLLNAKPRPDGVFCFSDRVAMSAMNYAIEQGVRVPEDIAFIGCGNLHYDDALRVPLSSIDLNSRRVGDEAARIALANLNSKTPLKPESVMLQPELIVRKSSQRRAGRKPAAPAKRPLVTAHS
jgi:LacI family transcriptional regulator